MTLLPLRSNSDPLSVQAKPDEVVKEEPRVFELGR
jgi:hypothetical protein